MTYIRLNTSRTPTIISSWKFITSLKFKTKRLNKLWTSTNAFSRINSSFPPPILSRLLNLISLKLSQPILLINMTRHLNITWRTAKREEFQRKIAWWLWKIFWRVWQQYCRLDIAQWHYALIVSFDVFQRIRNKDQRFGR